MRSYYMRSCNLVEEGEGWDECVVKYECKQAAVKSLTHTHTHSLPRPTIVNAPNKHARTQQTIPLSQPNEKWTSPNKRVRTLVVVRRKEFVVVNIIEHFHWKKSKKKANMILNDENTNIINKVSKTANGGKKGKTIEET